MLARVRSMGGRHFAFTEGGFCGVKSSLFLSGTVTGLLSKSAIDVVAGDEGAGAGTDVVGF